MGDRAAAVQMFNQGVSSSNDRSQSVYLTHAFQQFVSAMYVDPTWWQAAYQCGNNAVDLKFLHAAVACQRRALECGSTDIERAKILANLGYVLHELGQIAEAKIHSLEAAKLDPTLAHAYHNLSCIAGLQDDSKLAVEYARKAFAIMPEPMSEALLSFALLFDRQYAEGFRHFECRFAWRLHQFEQYPYPEGRWTGQDDKTIFLVADQGLGDTLTFARFIPLACKKAKYVHACVQPELLRLFQTAFVDIPNLNLTPSPSPFPQADHWSTMVSLPFALGLTDDEIRTTPHIKAVRYEKPKTWKVPDRKFHIGIAWAGSTLNDINKYRSIPVTYFLDLYKVPGIQLYGLQVDSKKEDAHHAGCAPVIRDISGYISDVADTLFILDQLDLVITLESALGHICTLAGTETWVPISFQGRDYRVGHDGTDQLWSKYRIFRQGPDLQWQPVFDRIVEALKERLNAQG